MIEVKNICVEVENKVIFENLSFTAQNGEILVITGANGTGKTTLLKAIFGIIPLKSGEIFLDGEDITNKDISARARLGLSYAFQEPVAFKGLTVKDVLEIASQGTQKIGDACPHLSQVGLCARDYLERPFDKTLSGGERKRIELASIIAKNSPNNLFDEPEAGIDMWSFENTCNLFSALKKENKAIVIVSHNQNIINIADKVLVLENGKLVSAQGKNIVCPRLNGGAN